MGKEEQWAKNKRSRLISNLAYEAIKTIQEQKCTDVEIKSFLNCIEQVLLTGDRELKIGLLLIIATSRTEPFPE